MISLTKEQIIMIHQALIEATGGSQGVRDEGMLESALAAPFAAYGEEEFFPTVEEKAARLAIGLVNNHPMIDGNKRIGAHAMLLTLRLNGISLQYSQTELSDQFLAVASGECDYKELLQWIKSHKA